MGGGRAARVYIDREGGGDGGECVGVGVGGGGGGGRYTRVDAWGMKFCVSTIVHSKYE